MIFSKKYKLLHYFIVVFICNLLLMVNVEASKHNFLLQTSRMKSTAGAGIASFLVDESTLLNPATLAFFNLSSIYYSKTTTKADQYSNMKNWSVAASDTSSSTKGSFSYFKADIDSETQKQWAIALASPISKNSSIGFSYRRNKISNLTESRINNFLSVGFIHIISENFILALVFDDPTHNSDNTRITTGMQYLLKGMISFMFDFGANFRKDVTKTFVYKTALQIKLLSNFYLRYGIAKDDFLLTKTNGAGLGWVGPKLNLDISLQNVDDRSVTNNNFKESSFSISYRF